MAGGGGGGGGVRALRRADSSPRSPLALSRNDSIKKKGRKKGSKRARLRAGLSAVLHELRLAAPKAREKGYSTDAVERLGRGASAAVVCVPFGRPTNGSGSGGGGRRCASWTLAAALVLVLACVVALGKVPAICCCTCAAWWCGGRHSSAQPKAGSGSRCTVPCAGRGRHGV